MDKKEYKNYYKYSSDTRYEKVLEQMKLLNIEDITTDRQHKNGTIVWKLPIKDQDSGILIEVASFASGYVRNQGKSTRSNFQLNKRCEGEPEFYEVQLTKSGQKLYRKFTTKSCKLIPIEIDRLEYLISYCLKNYYIKNANQVADGKFVPKWKLENAQNGMVPKWKYDEAMNLGRTNAEAEALNETLNNEFYLDKAYERIKELEDKLEKANKENEWQNKQDVATRVKELDLQNKLDTIKRIADYE